MMPIGPRSEAGARLEIEPFEHAELPQDGVRMITHLYTDQSRRRQGDARYLLCEVCVEADRTRTVLMLEPKPDDDSPLDAMALELFYRRFGFVVGQREPMTLMIRGPR